jgi:hypothetical protein
LAGGAGRRRRLSSQASGEPEFAGAQRVIPIWLRRARVWSLGRGGYGGEFRTGLYPLRVVAKQPDRVEPLRIAAHSPGSFPICTLPELSKTLSDRFVPIALWTYSWILGREGRTGRGGELGTRFDPNGVVTKKSSGIELLSVPTQLLRPLPITTLPVLPVALSNRFVSIAFRTSLSWCGGCGAALDIYREVAADRRRVMENRASRTVSNCEEASAAIEVASTAHPRRVVSIGLPLANRVLHWRHSHWSLRRLLDWSRSGATEDVGSLVTQSGRWIEDLLIFAYGVPRVTIHAPPIVRGAGTFGGIEEVSVGFRTGVVFR